MLAAGKRRREAAWSQDTSEQLAAFDVKLPALLANWTIEKERQQWTEASDYRNHNCTARKLS